MNVLIHVATEEAGTVSQLMCLEDPRLYLRYELTGSQRYISGTLESVGHDLATSLFDHAMSGSAWVVVNGEYARIHTVRSAESGWTVDFDQSAVAAYARFVGGSGASLRIVEPSPPRSAKKWVEAERRRAIRDHIAVHGGRLDWRFEVRRRWHYSRLRKITNTHFAWVASRPTGTRQEGQPE